MKGLKRQIRRAICYVATAALLVGIVPAAAPRTARAADSEINDSGTATEADGYKFDHSYVKPGDTLKILKAEDGSQVTEGISWTVKKVKSGTDGNIVEWEQIATSQDPALEITEKYMECMIYGEVSGIKLSIYCSKTPVIYINTLVPYYDVGDDYTKEDTTRIHLVGNDTYNDENYWYNGTGQVKLRGNSTKWRPKRPFKVKLSEKADLLGLGSEKTSEGTKSYPSKHWVLLANDIDHSLLRNKLLYDFSGDIGTEFYFHSTNVTLIYNGQYEGVYQLCEHRRVDPGRIDIFDWTGAAEDAADAIGESEAAKNGWDKDTKKKFTGELEDIMAENYSWIDEKKVVYTGDSQPSLKGTEYAFSDYKITLPATNGGFLGEMDFYSVGDNTVAGMETNYKQPIYFSAPEPGEDASEEDKPSIVNSFKQTSLYKYAKNYTQTFEYALHSDDFYFRNSDEKYRTDQIGNFDKNWADATYSIATYTDAANDGKHYSQLFDMDSLVTNFLFDEYAMNWDSMKNSFFFYKKVDELAKFGPQWDYDWCWGNVNMFNIDTNFPTKWQTTIEKFTEEQYYQTVQWNRMLIRDPYFLTLAYEKYKGTVRPVIENMIKSGGLIDQYEEYLKEAGAANDARWSYTYNREYQGGKSMNFSDSLAHIRSFLNTRVAWLDEQFATVPKLISSLGYYRPSDDMELTGTAGGSDVTLTLKTTDEDVKKVRFQINGTLVKDETVSNGTASVVLNSSELRESGLNAVVANAVDAEGNYIYNTPASKTGNYNVVESDYLIFKMNNGALDIQDKSTASYEDTGDNSDDDSDVDSGDDWDDDSYVDDEDDYDDSDSGSAKKKIKIISVKAKRGSKKITGKLSVKKAAVKVKVGKKKFKKAKVSGKKFTFKTAALKKGTKIQIKATKKNYKAGTKTVKVK